MEPEEPTPDEAVPFKDCPDGVEERFWYGSPWICDCMDKVRNVFAIPTLDDVWKCVVCGEKPMLNPVWGGWHS